MNDNDYEMIGESIWDTYRNMASILAEAFEKPGEKFWQPTEGGPSHSQHVALRRQKVKKHGKGQGELVPDPHRKRTYFTDDPRAPRSQRTPLYPGERSNLGRDDVPARSTGK